MQEAKRSPKFDVAATSSIFPEVYRVVEVRNFKELFRKHDDDGSGDLSIEEIDPLIREIGYIPSQALARGDARLNRGTAANQAGEPPASVEYLRTFTTQYSVGCSHFFIFSVEWFNVSSSGV